MQRVLEGGWQHDNGRGCQNGQLYTTTLEYFLGISDMQQRRENEMKIALDENDKLMDRYRKLEAELQASQHSNTMLRDQFDDQIENAENRIKLTQE